jgi:NADP-dependent 3-hydroxy acid dehydrogenase YdfG
MYEWAKDSMADVDIAIGTSGKMLIQHPAKLDSYVLHRMVALNYLIPREFTEQMLAAGAKLIIHIGSNSARYGKPYAEEYASMKAALWKYCEIRGALAAKENGARITVVNLGGVNNGFWDSVRSADGFDVAAAANLIPAEGNGLTNAEVAELVLALCLLPENVAVKDLLVTARAYQ